MRPVDPRLLREAPAVRTFLAAAAVLGALGAVATVLQAAALGRIVAAIVLHHAGPASLHRELGLLAGATVARAALGWLLESGGRLTALRVGTRLRGKLLAHLLEVRPRGLPETPAGELAATAVTGLDALEPYFARFLPQVVQSLVVPVVVLAWVIPRDLTSAIVLAATLPLIPLFGAVVGKATAVRTERRYRTLAILSAHFLDLVRGLPTLRAFGRSDRQSAAIAASSEAYRRETMGTLRIAFLSAFVLELAATLGTAMIAVEIGVRLVDGRIALAPALAVLVLAPEVYGPLRSAAAQFHASADGLAAAQRIFDLLDLAPAVARPALSVPAPDLRETPIVLDDVSLAYEGRPEPALSGVSAVVAPGELVAVAGSSGAGKTSLLAVLARLVDPTGGRVRAGSVDLSGIAPEDWRRQVAWLPQRPRLGTGTLRDALTAGRRLDDARLRRALAAASIAHLVDALPAGLDTALDERAALSAGELRRLGLARALAGDEPLLLLDEPTAHLDGRSGAAAVETIRGLAGTRTVVVATHDPRLTAAADRVIDLADASALLESVA